MEFAEARRLFIENLKKHKFYLFTERFDIMDKNKLYAGSVTVKFVLDKIENCKKENYNHEFSLEADDNKAHIFIKDRWYFKYILKINIVHIISVHRENKYARIQ